MIASKNTLRHLLPLILFGVFFCVSHLSAQQPETADKTSVLLTGSAASPGNVEWILPDQAQNQILQQLLSNLSANPGNAEVLKQLDALLAEVLDQVNGLMDDGSLVQAEQTLLVLQSIDPGLVGVSAANKRLQTLSEIDDLLEAGNTALEFQRILNPENDNALYYYKQALRKDPESRPVQLGLARVQAALIGLALEFARELDFETAADWLSEASTVRQDQTLVEDGRVAVVTIKQQHAAELELKALAAINAERFALVDFYVIDLMALGEQQARVESLRARLEAVRFYSGFEPGQIIRDELLQSGGNAPEIIVIPAGSFLMGSRNSALANEKPQHRITIKRGFGLGTREVTVAEFRLFIERSGYRTAAERDGGSTAYDESNGRIHRRSGVSWQHDYKGNKAGPNLPVLHVNLHDAQAYVQWLSSETGKAYRLPSEAEYEYVARAGGSGTYWWGAGSPAESVENLTGDRDNSPGKRQWTNSFKRYGDGHWGPAPVGSIGSGKLVHPMGIHDIAGNVSEWTADCWHQSYVKAPVDGTAWVNPGCNRRVVRGGYWASSPAQARAAFRVSAKAETYSPLVGIRIARDL